MTSTALDATAGSGNRNETVPLHDPYETSQAAVSSLTPSPPSPPTPPQQPLPTPELQRQPAAVIDTPLSPYTSRVRRDSFVCGLPDNCSSYTLKVYFGRYGEIVDAYIPRNKHTGRPQNYGFVAFGDSKCAKQVPRSYKKACVCVADCRWIVCVCGVASVRVHRLCG